MSIGDVRTNFSLMSMAMVKKRLKERLAIAGSTVVLKEKNVPSVHFVKTQSNSAAFSMSVSSRFIFCVIFNNNSRIPTNFHKT